MSRCRWFYQSQGWTTIKPISGGEKRDISTVCEVVPYDVREYQKPVTSESYSLHELGTAKTIADLMLLIVAARYEKGMAPKKKAIIIRAGQRYGLIDDEGRKTSKYFALVNDDVERLCRELTGKQKQAPGLCACGCGRMVRGRAKTATAACRKRLSRKITDVTVKPEIALASS